MKDILYPEEIKQEHDKRLLTLNRRVKMYYLIDGTLSVLQFNGKRDLNVHIKQEAERGYRYQFVKDLSEIIPVIAFLRKAVLINGDIVVPREKRVVVEYEVE